MPRDTRAAFLDALKRADRRIYQAFTEAMAAVRNTASMTAIERAIETGDVQAVMEALSLRPAALEGVQEAIRQALREGAAYQNATAPAAEIAGLQLGFDGSHPRILSWLAQNAAALVTEVLDDQRTVIREAIAAGLTENIGYASIARNLAGRMDGNQRKGGLVGLHSTQARAVRAMRADLEALDGRYFSRKRRDRRFDRTVRKAIREGQALTPAVMDKITGRYSDRLLALRGETIARTEANKAMNEGRAEAIVQMIESGEAPADAVTKIWDATPGPRTRDSHRQLNGTKVKWGEPFVSPVTGAEMAWPHAEGIPAEEAVNCRCSCRFRVDWLAVRDRRRELRAQQA